MSGHNKWSQIKRTKGASDAKRSQMFGKLSRMISTQVKMAKGDRNATAVISAIDKARAADMPNDTIERAISKATEAKELETILYEAYGPGGAAIIIDTLTDSRNRTAQEIKHLLSKNGLALAAPGSAAWAFEKTHEGYVPTTTVPLSEDDHAALMKILEEIDEHDDVEEVYTNAE